MTAVSTNRSKRPARPAWASVRGLGLGRVSGLAVAVLIGCSTPMPAVPPRPFPSAVPLAAPAPPADARPSEAAASSSSTGGNAPEAGAPATPVEPLPATASPPAAPPPAETAAVAARFPDPAASYRTPAFEPGRTAYTSDTELRAAMLALLGARRPGDATTLRIVQAGSSQTGVPIEAMHFSRAPPASASASASAPAPAPAPALGAAGAAARASRPVVLLIGQQHGDEPAGSEALLVIAGELAPGGSLGAVLDRIDVVVLPRANPDAARVGKRLTASGIDVNRDHLLLRTPEAQAQAQLVRDFAPVVVVDAHEFSVLGRWVEKFGAVQRFDALIQYATVANLPEFVTRASEEWFRQPLLQALGAQGLSHEWYYTTSLDVADKKVSMGGVQPDTGRNVNGLRHAISVLIETRGIGLGREHLARRVHTHVTAIASVLKSAAARADDLQKLRRFVDAEVVAKVCQGEVIVEAAATPSEYTLLMLDPQTGADKRVTVAWDSALELAVLKRRARPCGYWLGADQTDAALRLRALGVQVQRIDETGTVQGESYLETAREQGQRADVRGSLAEGAGVVRVKVELVPALIDVRQGSYYIGLDQPLANLVVAALEPDTQNSFVANRVVSGVEAQARVLRRPALKMTPMQ